MLSTEYLGVEKAVKFAWSGMVKNLSYHLTLASQRLQQPERSKIPLSSRRARLETEEVECRNGDG